MSTIIIPPKKTKTSSSSSTPTHPNGFGTWAEVLAYAQEGEAIGYQGPMDYRQSRVLVIKKYKGGKLRIDPMNNQVDNFTADKGHLDRFRKL